jgi:hypothetical protein
MVKTDHVQIGVKMKESSRFKPIRPFIKDDIPQVVSLFERLLLSDTPSRRQLAPDKLSDYFEQILFHNPWYDEELSSMVYQGTEGKILGFLGVVPRRMVFGNQPIRVAISFHFMVEPDSRTTLAGVQLLKTFFSGPQDLSFTDGAGQVGRRVWEGVGGTTALLYSQRWRRILRPSHQAVHLLTKKSIIGKNKLGELVARAASPICNLSDAAIERMVPRYFPANHTAGSEEALEAEIFLENLPQFSKHLAMRPSYDADSLNWLIGHAEEMKLHGTFKQLVVRDARGEVIGWYMYYLNPGGLSQVLQIACKKNMAGAVLDHLFDHARRHGAYSIMGRQEPQFMEELSEKFCFFSREGGWTLIHANDREILHAIQRGDAFFTGLEGEWCLLF